MKCPACYNKLTEVRVGSLAVDICRNGCGGIWFDAFELKRVDEEGEEAARLLLNIPRDPAVVVDPARKRECPRCAGVKLHRHFFSARRQVQVDQCPNCGGYWLDAGELEIVRQETGRGIDVSRARQEVTSGQVIRYLYQLQVQMQTRIASDSSRSNR